MNGTAPTVGFSLELALTSGKVALASNTTKVTGPTASNVLDFVGYGLANQYEGSGAAPSPSILNSITRFTGDTNNNNVGFTVTLPTPQAGVLAVSDIVSTSASNNVIQNTLVKNNEIGFRSNVKEVKVYALSGQLVKTGSISNNDKLNIAELQE